MKTRAYSVDTVQTILMRSHSQNLVITAEGRAASSGWSEAELVPFVYVVPPSDGVLDCDLVAQPPAPGSITLPILTPIATELTLPDADIDNYWGPGRDLVGVRVHAVGNTKTSDLTDRRPGVPKMRIIDSHDAEAVSTRSYAEDILPLFRLRDIAQLRAVHGIDLCSYDKIVDKTDELLDLLTSGNFPVDGNLPEADLNLLRSWIQAGKPR